MPRWVAAPEQELPASIGTDLLLARGDKLALLITRPAAYVDGMTFDLTVVRRSQDLHARPRELFDHRLQFHGPEPGEPLPDAFLRFGVSFEDGRRASNVGGIQTQLSDGDAPPKITLRQQGGGGGSHVYRIGWYVWPLPDQGNITFVCEWPSFSIPETTGSIDGDLVREAARRTRPIWPQL